MHWPTYALQGKNVFWFFFSKKNCFLALMTWINVAARADVPAGGMLEVEAGDAAVMLYDLAGVLHATSAICPHQAAFLSQGGISGDCVDCPRHMGRFHIPTGKLVRGPDSPDLRVFPVELREDRVFVEVG
jgi:nitrite reductase/ring-hydroxylating ferredoxin subunit